MLIKDIIYREDLYPRFEPNQKIIEKYSNSIEYLPAIKINQNNILIDGFHRWKAHELKKIKEIKIEIIKTQSEKELKKMAYQYNSNHGLQLNNDEKKKFACEMIEELSIKELSNIISVSESTLRDWTKTRREETEKERNRKILEMYLRCHTQQEIAKEFELNRDTVIQIIKKMSENSEFAKIRQNFQPYLYNIWNSKKQDNETSHFGAFPGNIYENLLYYHTEIFDIIYDPFAGNGTTIDVCKKWLRRYYCSDRIIKPGREKDMKQHDIKDGIPEDLKKPQFIFLDPPYWKQAENKYSSDKDDLGNMELNDFYNVFNIFLIELIKWKVNKIAIIIQPTLIKNNWIYEDHILKFNEILNKKYDIEMRYILPYSTQQYIPQQVEKAKKIKICLPLNRDLIIWRIK